MFIIIIIIRQAAVCYDMAKIKNGSFKGLNFPDSIAPVAAIAAAGAVTIVPATVSTIKLTSRFVGAYYDGRIKGPNKWFSTIGVGGVTRYLGSYINEEDCGSGTPPFRTFPHRSVRTFSRLQSRPLPSYIQ
jgi:hypothetical protein